MAALCPPSSALYFSAACGLSVGVLGFSSSPSLLVPTSLLLPLLAAHQLSSCHVPSTLWAHSLCGTALLRGGRAMLSSESGLLQIPPPLAMLGALLFLSIIVGEARELAALE